MAGSIGYNDTDPTQIVDPNANHDETTVLRAALIWSPMDAVTVTPSFVFQNRERHDTSYYWSIYSSPGSDKFVSANPTAQQDPDKYMLPSLKVTADFGGMEFVSNSSYYYRRDTSGYDGTLYNLSYYQTLGWQGGETSPPYGVTPRSAADPTPTGPTAHSMRAPPCPAPARKATAAIRCWTATACTCPRP